ncbi:aspartate-semialdehyde dehydrogenase [Ancylomarina sp. DW003]|nr:aspartate-semialdehyde dehydrogenase [Ancylomarina sp. DW003]MDE5420944.1 aspartate-semialdehyde dehydrogenase [Ancylomarina sp. DW003]
MKIAVVGATGLVGQKILDVLTERNFPIDELYPVASERSKGKKIEFRGKEVTVIGMKEAIELKPHIAIFSAGGSTSLEWAPEFEKAGTFVVDNSSAWRMHPEKKLIVPEINASELSVDDKIIANPNCSTIQMVVALAPLHKKYKIKRLIISTYQSISGTGVKAVEQLDNERAGIDGEMAYPYPIDKNCLPHCDVFEDNAYTKEEMKLINETRKILCDDSIRITATAVRVPVVGGHSESVNIEFEKDFDLDELKNLLSESEGVILQDEPEKNIYPMPKFAHEQDEVFVGRIRRDFSNPNSLNMWIVADNLRKGAATNAIQIAEYLTQNGIVQ